MRIGVLFILLSIGPVLIPVSGQDAPGPPPAIPADAVPDASPDGQPKRVSYMQKKLQFTVNSGIGFNSQQFHFTGGLQLDYQPNPVVGLGLRTTVDYGLRYHNLNINIFALYKIWWLYVGPGISFVVQGMDVGVPDSEYDAVVPYDGLTSLAITIGFRFPIARIGPGHLTIDTSVDWYQNDYPINGPGPPYDGSVLQEILDGAIYAFKVGLRLGYTF